MEKKTRSMVQPVPERTFKSRIFIMLFEEKEKLLELYNAVSGKHYEDPELLEINTLENAIYVGIKNDLSFLIDSRLHLYEHQSTWSPNLPLRFLFYLSDLYSEMTAEENLYGTKKVKIPMPHFVIFYNGESDQADRQALRLSDLYTVEEERYKLDLEAVMLNINKGHNAELLKASRTLSDYVEYTDRVRNYTKEMPVKAAVERAIEECIYEGILKEFLKKNRAEVMKVSLYEYDKERHIRQEKEASYEEGVKMGEEIGIRKGEDELLRKQICKNLKKGLSIPEIAELLDQPEERILELRGKM